MPRPRLSPGWETRSIRRPACAPKAKNGEKVAKITKTAYDAIGKKKTAGITTKRSKVKAKAGKYAKQTVNTSTDKRTFKMVGQGWYGQFQASHGCAASSAACIISGYVDKYKDIDGTYVHNVLEKRTFEKKKEWAVSVNGIQKIFKKVGIESKLVTKFKRDELAKNMREELKAGHQLVVTVCSKDYTRNKITKKYTQCIHTMAVIGLTDDGKAILADSSDRTWSGNRQRFKLVSLKDLAKYVTQAKNYDPDVDYYKKRSISGGYLVVYGKAGEGDASADAKKEADKEEAKARAQAEKESDADAKAAKKSKEPEKKKDGKPSKNRKKTKS